MTDKIKVQGKVVKCQDCGKVLTAENMACLNKKYGSHKIKKAKCQSCYEKPKRRSYSSYRRT